MTPRPRVTWRWNAYVALWGFVMCHESPRPCWRTFKVKHGAANDVAPWWVQ